MMYIIYLSLNIDNNRIKEIISKCFNVHNLDILIINDGDSILRKPDILVAKDESICGDFKLLLHISISDFNISEINLSKVFVQESNTFCLIPDDTNNPYRYIYIDRSLTPRYVFLDQVLLDSSDDTNFTISEYLEEVDPSTFT